MKDRWGTDLEDSWVDRKTEGFGGEGQMAGDMEEFWIWF